MTRNQKVSIPADGVDILPKLRPKSDPPMKGRHEKFQFGNNPMEMTPFEKSRAALEVEERKMIKEKYIKGIQGCDGGVFPQDQTKDDSLTVPFNVKATY
jgi:hypothetical protein